MADRTSRPRPPGVTGRPAPKVHPSRSGPVEVELVSVGGDLLRGRVEDRNAPMLARLLTQRGWTVGRVTVVGDDEAAVSSAIREAFERRCHLVITTGGLGPAAEDRTLAAVSDALGLPLAVHAQAKSGVEAAYRRLAASDRAVKTGLTAAREKMCRIPVGGLPLDNPIGVAPGVLCRLAGGGAVLCLPGQPQEAEALLLRGLAELKLPARRFDLASREIEAPTTDESSLGPMLSRLAEEFPGLWVSSYPAARGEGGPTRIRLEATGVDRREAEAAVDQAVRRLLALAAGSR